MSLYKILAKLHLLIIISTKDIHLYGLSIRTNDANSQNVFKICKICTTNNNNVSATYRAHAVASAPDLGLFMCCFSYFEAELDSNGNIIKDENNAVVYKWLSSKIYT